MPPAKQSPRVSVLMTTHNGERTIRDSIASILGQEMVDLELIVVDDASSDATPVILQTVIDPRFVLIRSDTRLGIAGARNRGLKHCKAPYIATIDHDDLSDPHRLRLQTAYLDAHPETVLVATGVQELHDDGRISREDQPLFTSPPLLRLLLHFDNPFAWSSIMLRAEAVRKLDPPVLRPIFEPADDFDLYHRLLALGDVSRIDAPLTTYRWHAGNFSRRVAARIGTNATRVLRRAYAPWLGEEALAAAALVVRHGNERVAVSDKATLVRLRDIINRVASGLAESQPTGRTEIIDGARQLLWRFTRAGVRSGHPHLFRLPAPPLDGLNSLIIGTVRSVLGGTSLLK